MDVGDPEQQPPSQIWDNLVKIATTGQPVFADFLRIE